MESSLLSPRLVVVVHQACNCDWQDSVVRPWSSGWRVWLACNRHFGLLPLLWLVRTPHGKGAIFCNIPSHVTARAAQGLIPTALVMMEPSEGPGRAGGLVPPVPKWARPEVWLLPSAPLLGSILEACHLGSDISDRGRAGSGETWWGRPAPIVECRKIPDPHGESGQQKTHQVELRVTGQKGPMGSRPG